MHFRTEIKIDKAKHCINLKHDILTTGSCFSDAIGHKLDENKFSVAVNPFGATYNPISIHKILRASLNNAYPAPHSYFEHNGLFAHYDFHSAFSNPEKGELEEAVKLTIRDTHSFLKTAHWIVITYGTAWVYKRNETGDVVANCHKVPAQNFTKELLTEKKIVESFQAFYQNLKAVNPSCKIILTVSPVRHIKDSLPLNGVSKAVLRSACHSIGELFREVQYFPAFEIMMDDLRDYRFYKTDMLHPSADAEEYIWQKFTDTFFDNPTQDFLVRWKPIFAALHHRPFHGQSNSHQSFLKKLLQELSDLRGTVNVDAELASVNAQLHER
jgi:GSCFA family